MPSRESREVPLEFVQRAVRAGCRLKVPPYVRHRKDLSKYGVYLAAPRWHEAERNQWAAEFYFCNFRGVHISVPGYLLDGRVCGLVL
jgi:hypothetical protein